MRQTIHWFSLVAVVVTVLGEVHDALVIALLHLVLPHQQPRPVLLPVPHQQTALVHNRYVGLSSLFCLVIT